MDKKKSLFLTISIAVISTVAIAGSVTFAWFQANAQVSIQTNSSSATITVSEPEQSLKITKITVKGDTTTELTPSVTSSDKGAYQISLTDDRRLTDVSGDASFLSDGTTPVDPVSLFKPVFASNYNTSNVNNGYATIFDVSDKTTSFSSLSTGDAYPYVRFGFKIQNITNASKAVYPMYRLTESTGMHIARVSVCKLTTSYTSNQTDFTSVEHSDWVEKAYLGTEAEAVTPICEASDDPGYTFLISQSNGSNIVSISGDTFSTYLGASKTTVDASSTYAPNSPIVTLAANGQSNDSAFFAVTIWVEGQDPDCWSDSTITNNISFSIDMI